MSRQSTTPPTQTNQSLTTAALADRKPKVAIVIPAYNEEASIQQVVKQCLVYQLPVIVINDGSTDDTNEQLKGLPITLLQNRQNLGKGASLQRGFSTAQAMDIDGVITLDGDGQHNCEHIMQFLTKISLNPHQLLIGARQLDIEKAPKSRHFANRFADFWISWAAGQKITDSQSGFKYYPNKLLQQKKLCAWKQHGFAFESQLLIDAGQAGVEIQSFAIEKIYPKQARKSHFVPSRDISHITLLVAIHLIKHGLKLPSLWRIYR